MEFFTQITDINIETEIKFIMWNYFSLIMEYCVDWIV